MSNVKSELQDYLSGGRKGSGSGRKGEDKPLGLAAASSRFSSWIGARSPNSFASSQAGGADDGSGWFSQAQTDPLLPNLSKKQRVIGFIGCLLMGTFCFSLASLYIPLLVLKARKFAMLYTMGSLFIIASFSLLWGPVHHVKHLLSMERLPFTIAYFGTMSATLYFALSVQSYFLTMIFAVGQVLALVWYIISYIPGGQTGLRFFTKVFYLAASKTVNKTLPV